MQLIENSMTLFWPFYWHQRSWGQIKGHIIFTTCFHKTLIKRCTIFSLINDNDLMYFPVFRCLNYPDSACRLTPIYDTDLMYFTVFRCLYYPSWACRLTAIYATYLMYFPSIQMFIYNLDSYSRLTLINDNDLMYIPVFRCGGKGVSGARYGRYSLPHRTRRPTPGVLSQQQQQLPDFWAVSSFWVNLDFWVNFQDQMLEFRVNLRPTYEGNQRVLKNIDWLNHNVTLKQFVLFNFPASILKCRGWDKEYGISTPVSV